MFARFGAHSKFTNIPFQENYFVVFSTFLYISFGLSGHLQTAFELKIALPTTRNQPDATALREFAKTSKRHQNICSKSYNVPKDKKYQIWGLLDSHGFLGTSLRMLPPSILAHPPSHECSTGTQPIRITCTLIHRLTDTQTTKRNGGTREA